MRQDYTDITIVLDRSGSMSSTANAVVAGFNEFIEGQKREPGLLRVTMTQFDSEHETVYNGVPVQEVGPLVFQPRGSTALFDAIGRAITATGQRLRALPENERPANILFVVITDGGENASRTYTSKQQIADMIQHQTNAYNWTFVYIGANQDAFAESSGMGFSSGNTMNYAANQQGTQSTYRSLGGKMSAIRTCAPGSDKYTKGAFFDQEDYDAQAAAGANNPAAATTGSNGQS